MSKEESDVPENKRRQLNSVSSPMAKNYSPSSDNKTADTAVLQYQNQKLVQQLEAQKNEMHTLEGKLKELKHKQISYDETLITVNKLWNQLTDDLIFLGFRTGGYKNTLEALECADSSRGSMPLCPPEDTFLCRLLQVETMGKNERMKYVEEALTSRHSSTLELMKYLEETIVAQRAITDSLASALRGKISAEDALIHLRKIDDSLRDEVINLRKVIDVIHLKHKQYADEIRTSLEDHVIDEEEIQRLEGELEESMSELEDSQRKLVNLKMQKEGASGVHIPVLNALNGSSSPDNAADRTMGLRELKDSVEEAKILAASRLSELQEAHKDNLILSKQLEGLQNELENEKYVVSSRPYSLLSDQLQHLNSELERYKGITDSLQADRNNVMRREKELSAKADAADAATSAASNGEVRIEELELQLQKCIVDVNELEIKVEAAEQDSGRNDIKAEFRVMASALSKEVEMLEIQLNRCKDTARESLSLRGEAHSLEALLNRKTSQCKILSNRYGERTLEIKSLKALIEKLQKEKQEMQIFLDMYGQECFDNRDVMEIKESERRAQAQAEILRAALDEHSLELRVKAANEAEAACQQRLSAAEAEIADLRTQVDASERNVLELTEAIKVKAAEGEAYISEIETIGQAYEDMQTQNQHLLQQVAERDDYNIKLVSESVKAKQAQACLLAEKQAVANKLQQVKSSVEFFKSKIARGEEQMKTYLTQAAKASVENRQLSTSTESAKSQLAEAEKKLKWLRSAVDASERQYEQNQRKKLELQMQLEKERNERKKLDEELAVMKRKVAEMNSESGEDAVQKLQDEIKECKSILKCGVCFDRPKEVVITKCYHLFCNPCIQRNLELRHRKCPGCGTAFGQNDVRFVNI